MAYQQYKDNQPRSQRLNPIWRGIGCVSLLVLTLGAYWAAGALLKFNRTAHFIPAMYVPPDVVQTIGPIDTPWGMKGLSFSWIQIAASVVVDIVVLTVAYFTYSMMNPIKLGPHDAPPVRPRKDRKKNLTR